MLDQIQAQGITEDTIVVFTSDNGGIYTAEALAGGHRPNGELLGQKTDAWEGGHRVPLIARWPGHFPAGASCRRLVCQTDLFATIAAAVNVPVPNGAAEDSMSQLAVFREPETAAAIRTEMLSQGARGYAYRQDEWVYLPRQGSLGWTVPPDARSGWPPYASCGMTTSDVDDTGHVKPTAAEDQLYNLDDDPRQMKNVAREHPDRASAMRSRLARMVSPPPYAARGQ